MFDAMSYLDRKCRGEQWHLLAREAGMPMGQLRAALEAVGADRLAAAGYRITASPAAARPARHPKLHRRRRVSVTKAPTPPNGIPEFDLPAILPVWREAKAQHPGMLPLFRVNGSYAVFGEDAELLGRELGLTLIYRGSTALAGFPHDQLETYLRKLLHAGHRVAVCDKSASETEPAGAAVPEAPPPEIPAFDRAADSPKLTDKYRPRTLAEVLGQPEIVANLQRFVASPYSCAMLFTGDSGIGKTSAAYALAHDLGCAVEEEECGGVFEIPSGSQTAESVRKILDLLRYRPMYGSGWRVLMVNECDRMALPVETIWLDALEHLPPQTVVVFTTNEPARLSQRFRNRCEEYLFQGGSDRLKPWIDALARRLWERECTGPMPDLDGLGMPTLGDAGSMTTSFRLALQQLQKLLRTA